MDAASRNAAVATIVGALIGAGGAVAAAYINLLKPSDKQVESSAQFRAVQSQLSQLENSLRSAVPAVSPERLSALETSNAALREENAQLLRRLAALELEAKRLASAAPSVSPPPITRPALATELKPSSPTVGSQRQTTYTVTIGAVTRTDDGTTISMSSLREYANRRLGANFYVDGKAGKTYYPGQRVVAKKTRDVECYFDVLSLEGTDKAPSTARATLEYSCTSP